VTIRLGTRSSALAVVQSGAVAELIAEASGTPVDLVTMHSEGDLITTPLAQLGGTGVFAASLRMSLLAGRCDLVVHSLKDLPVADYPGLSLGAVPLREDPRDALCARRGFTLETLPVGARVGTGSPRRAAALLARRPDLEILAIRGNVDTRLARVKQGDLHAVVLAAAGLARLGRLDAVTEFFDFATMPAAPGQGALAVEVLSSELEEQTALAVAIRSVDDADTHASVVAERAVLARLEAGCSAPIGASGAVAKQKVTLSVSVIAPDGSRVLTAQGSEPLGTDALAAARELGHRLADDLLSQGAGEIVTPEVVR
jgi:hydroxymethylbilane synthase